MTTTPTGDAETIEGLRERLWLCQEKQRQHVQAFGLMVEERDGLRESLAKAEGELGRDLAVMNAKIAESTAREEARSWRVVAERCKSEANAAEARALKAESQVAEAMVALEKIAAFDDKAASNKLAVTGRYSGFDEPGAVQIAREALASLETKETDADV